jgi:hypothetical protein
VSGDDDDYNDDDDEDEEEGGLKVPLREKRGWSVNMVSFRTVFTLNFILRLEN